MVHPIWIGVCQRFWHLVFFLGPNLPLRCPFLQLFCLSIFWFVAGICYGSLMLVAYQALKELVLPKVALLSSCLVTWGFDVWALEGFSSIEESNGVNLVALDSEVLCDHTTFDNSSAHLPYSDWTCILLMLEKIIPFALSTVPFDCR